MYAYNEPIDLVDLTGFRPLAPAEAAFLRHYFGGSLDTSKIDIDGGLGTRPYSLFGNTIRMPYGAFIDSICLNDLDLSNARIAALFAHEAMHVMQRQHGKWVTFSAAVPQARYTFGGANPYGYERSPNSRTMLETFLNGTVEQQGQIFQDYVYAHLTGGDVGPYADIAAWTLRQ